MTKESTQPIGSMEQTSSHTHREACSGVHIGAHCLVKGDIRGAIVELTSRMLDNPDSSGIYGTTRFYDDLEDFIRGEIKSAIHAREEELRRQIMKLMQDEYPVDCIDGVTPVETYGYEATHNRALLDVLAILPLTTD